jgi:glycosyltransferase involved in cell wall biosynthesis
VIVFDSTRNKSWNGRGVKLDDSRLVIMKSANFSHALKLGTGEYNIKIIGKKRSGNGSLRIKIETESKNLMERKIVFSTSSWSEYSFPFKVRESSSGNIVLSRSGADFGSLEIARIIVDKQEKKESHTPKKVPSLKRKGGKVIYPESLTRIPKKRAAFIVPYGIYGGGEIYLQEFVNRIDRSLVDITFIYMRPNPLKYKLGGHITHRDIKNENHLEALLKAENFGYLIYYNSQRVYHKLVDFKRKGIISSKLIEIYHSDFEWPDAISKLPQREYVDHIVTVSSSLAIGIEGVGLDKRTIVPVGIDTNKFSIRKNKNIKTLLKMPHDQMIIGTVARLSPEKNIPYIFELAKVMPNSRFVIVGDGPQKKKLNASCPDNVSLMGFKSDVENYYNIFDAFVLPSKMEGTPISILEAMASGATVYCSNVGAIPDVIKPGYNGHFLTFDPIRDAKLIKKTCFDKEVIYNAREHIELYHDVESNSREFAGVLLSLDNFFTDIGEQDDNEFLFGEYI